MSPFWWFLLGILAGHLFWVVGIVCVLVQMTRGDPEVTEQAHHDIQRLRDTIRQRMAPRT